DRGPRTGDRGPRTWYFASAADFQALAESPRDVLDREDLVHRLLEVVVDPAEFHHLRFGVPDHVARARVAVARLADRADVDVVLPPVGELHLVGERARRVELEVLGENPRL